MYTNSIESIDASVTPGQIMNLLSPLEVKQLSDIQKSPVYQVFRKCALAVLNSGHHYSNPKAVLESHNHFGIEVLAQSRGIKLALHQAPPNAFVDGKLINGIREHLFACLRDVIYFENLVQQSRLNGNVLKGEATTDAVFQVLRHAHVLKSGPDSKIVMCWGGHSIPTHEYEYTKDVGYALGLRGMHIGTGCGPGAMKGPMKGATIGHAKQRTEGRYLGITEPSIISAEPPNPIVNQLVILPDIEKRLEAFVRMAHGIIVFPGGVGTAEEILYLLGILLAPENQDMPFPLIFTAPEESAAYFKKIDDFIGKTLGAHAQKRYQIIINDPNKVAIEMQKQTEAVFEYRTKHKDAFYYNWLLKISENFQEPFEPTHKNMASLNIHKNQPKHDLASNLRRAFSGIVAGNVKESGLKQIEQHGPFKIKGDPEIMNLMDQLLRDFVAQGRMSLGDKNYKPCYQIES
jgi:predicted Rossmann-fold nucleotide-binding protein